MGLNSSVTILAISVGVLSGAGIFTMYYGEGASYFSKNPRACTNCHIMEPQFESWQKASHHTVATCVDCHLPQDFLAKYIAKAENGYNHSKGFTLQDFAEPIVINRKNRVVLLENCLVCHGDLVHEITPRKREFRCLRCHATVGHGDAVGLGGAMGVADATRR